jgi:hypothetical protein
MKAHILSSATFPEKSFHLSDYVENYGRSREIAVEDIIRLMRFA